jgi:hypothetical protein
MILLNFSHPITARQREQLHTMLGTSIDRTIDLPIQFDEQQPFGAQLEALLETVPLSADEWQSEPLIMALPSLNFIAALLLAELHGRMGYFPTVIRMRPVEGATPRRYEIAEILDLQATREAARKRR